MKLNPKGNSLKSHLKALKEEGYVISLCFGNALLDMENCKEERKKIDQLKHVNPQGEWLPGTRVEATDEKKWMDQEFLQETVWAGLSDWLYIGGKGKKR